MTFTMKRVALELGVSITTVSKVLNNQPDIGPATRARVLKKVEELGYRPNAVARSLTLRRTNTLGVVIPDLMHSFFVEIVAGLESVMSARGYALLLCSSGEDAGKERRELEALKQRQVDGLVFASAHATGNEDLLRRLLRLQPTITAVFAANDPTAIGAMKAIWDAGLRVPEDIAVVGAGDIAHGDVLRVPLTTVSWSRQEMGTRAAELILERVEGRSLRTFRRVIIPPRLVVRASCGAAS